MNALLWAGLAANALVNLRIAVLHVQEGTDRVAAGVDKPEETVHWGPGGQGVATVIIWTMISPAVTAFTATKFLLFPRGIKSKFAKEQEAKAAVEAATKLQAEKDAVFLMSFQEAEAIVRAWNPGDIVLAESEPEQLALGWHTAADAFDSAADLIKRTAGQPWVHPKPAPQRRVKAKVGASVGKPWNEEEDAA